jgi:hypothetical protein
MCLMISGRVAWLLENAKAKGAAMMDRMKELRQFVADNKITFPDQRDPNAVAVTLTGDELRFLGQAVE